MNTIFMNSKNSKTSDPHIPLLNPKNKINYKVICNLKKVINMLLFQILAYILYMDWRVWIIDGQNSISDFQDYFEYILKNDNETIC